MSQSKQIFRKILCVRTDNMGDVIMTTPAFNALKETYPESELTLLTSSRGAAISPYIQSIQNTIIFDVPWTKINTCSNIATIVAKLKQKQFDAAFIFTNFSQNPLPEAMLCYMADIPQRIAYCRENPYNLLTTWIPDIEPFAQLTHGVERQLHLVQHLDAQSKHSQLSLFTPPKDIFSIITLLQKKRISPRKPFVLIHPGASEEKRRYPLQFFANVAKQLAKKYQVGITGTKNEYPLLRYIHAYCHERIYLFPNLSTGELIALTQMSNILLSNNTGPVHIAAAVQTPVVVLYALTNPEHTPWHVPNKVFYFPVKKELQTKNQILQTISYPPPQPFTVNMVTTAIERLMKPSPSYNQETNIAAYASL